MAFVNELISDADKQRIDWTNFKAWSYSDPHRPWKWTIDRECDVFLVMLAGRGREGEHPQIYALSWHGVVICFEAESGGEGTFATGVEMFWKVWNIRIPEHLEKQREAIFDALKKAIDAHGSVFDRENIKSVRVEFVKEQIRG